MVFVTMDVTHWIVVGMAVIAIKEQKSSVSSDILDICSLIAISYVQEQLEEGYDYLQHIPFLHDLAEANYTCTQVFNTIDRNNDDLIDLNEFIYFGDGSFNLTQQRAAQIDCTGCTESIIG